MDSADERFIYHVIGVGACMLRAAAGLTLLSVAVAWSVLPARRLGALAQPWGRRARGLWLVAGLRGGFGGCRMGLEKLHGSERADAWLRERDIPFKVIQQEQATGKCRDSAAERGVSLREIVKSMVYASPADDAQPAYLHCMVPGHLQVDESKLRQLAGGAARLLESDELHQVTGAVVGAVHPFVPGVSRRLVDKRILGDDGQGGAVGDGHVSFNTGDMTVGLVLTRTAFCQALGEQLCVVDLAVAEAGEDLQDLAHELGVSVPEAKFLREHDFALAFFRACVAELAASKSTPDADSTDRQVTPEPMSRQGAHSFRAVDSGIERRGDVLDWMRTLVRFADQSGGNATCVPVDWFVALVCRDAATKFAREEAIKQCLRDGTPPPLPAAAMAVDAGVLDALVTASIEENARAVDKLKGEGPGSKAAKKLHTFLMGDVMKRSKGALDPVHVRAALEARLATLL